MKKIKFINIILCILFLATSINAQEKVKLAQTGMKFLNANMDARSAALSDAITGVEGGTSFLFQNPSAFARQTNFSEFSVGQMSWIADINYYYAAATIAPEGGNYGVFGLSIMGVNYGELHGTIYGKGEQGFIETGVFYPYAYALGISYAKALSEKFQIGGTVRYVNQYLGPTYYAIDNNLNLSQKESESDVFSFDFGLIYKTGYKSLNFGMSVKNFATEVVYEKEQFQTPLTFKIGVSMNAFDLFEGFKPEMHSFLVSLDAVHYRDYPEQINIGAEYTFMQMFSLRGGYSTPNDERTYTLGGGVKTSISGYGLGVDYAYAPFGIFDPVHRFSVMFSL